MADTPTKPAPAKPDPKAVVPAITTTAAVASSATIAAITADAVDVKAGTYTVAPGRTVDGKGPGETVKLDEADAQRMRELGFILGKDGSIVVQADGPAVNVEDGVQVRTTV